MWLSQISVLPLHCDLCFTNDFKQQTGNLSRYYNDLILRKGIYDFGEEKTGVVYLNIILVSQLIWGYVFISGKWCLN